MDNSWAIKINTLGEWAMGKKADKINDFACLILRMANQEKINIRELREAFEMAILHCQEVVVPFPQYQKTNQAY